MLAPIWTEKPETARRLRQARSARLASERDALEDFLLIVPRRRAPSPRAHRDHAGLRFRARQGAPPLRSDRAGGLLAFSIGFVAGAGPNAWGALLAWERAGTSWNPPIPGTVKALIILVVFLIAVQAVVNFVADYRAGRRQEHVLLSETA